MLLFISESLNAMLIREPAVHFQEMITTYPQVRSVEVEKIFGVYYLHIICDNSDDLYLTRYGLPFVQQLFPWNFLTDKSWFEAYSEKLAGTSTTYKVRTKTIKGKYKDIVMKYNRMGQDIPGADDTAHLMNANFNSPFEEFALMMELKRTRYESPGIVLTQKPMAIYVPSERKDLWKTGRKQWMMETKVNSHTDVALDMFRAYVVVYEWVKGIDAVQACRQNILKEAEMKALTLRAEKELENKGFIVKDNKPHHLIVRPVKEGGLLKGKGGKIIYALVDYELLMRTPQREAAVKKEKRSSYLQKQKERFMRSHLDRFPPHLHHVKIFGVDYVCGRAESTDGLLWVVGCDPDLFDYFLPERWENTPRVKLSAHHEIYYTLTKDNIHLVWKVSNVGIQPDMDPFKEDERRIFEYGYNSPFEETSMAVDLREKGVRTTYPRAIYMSGKKVNIPDTILDDSRYLGHRYFKTPERNPILKKDHKYMIIWGYWNGPDERLAEKDGDYFEGINALTAYRKRIIIREEYIKLIQRKEERLEKAGLEDLNLGGSHLLLSLDSSGRLLKDKDGFPGMRICNFELLRYKAKVHRLNT